MIILGFLQVSLLFGGVAAYAQIKHDEGVISGALWVSSVVALALAGAAAGNGWGA